MTNPWLNKAEDQEKIDWVLEAAKLPLGLLPYMRGLHPQLSQYFERHVMYDTERAPKLTYDSNEIHSSTFPGIIVDWDAK